EEHEHDPRLRGARHAESVATGGAYPDGVVRQLRITFRTAARHRAGQKGRGQIVYVSAPASMQRCADNPLVTRVGLPMNEEVDRPRSHGPRPRLGRGPTLPSLVVPLLGFGHGRVLRDSPRSRPDRPRLDDVRRMGRHVSVFPGLRTDRAALVPLAVVSGTLIATHHLSFYFFLLMVLGTIIVQGLARPWRWTAGSKREVAYVSLLLAGTFVYWLVYATTFREF